MIESYSIIMLQWGKKSIVQVKGTIWIYFFKCSLGANAVEFWPQVLFEHLLLKTLNV